MNETSAPDTAVRDSIVYWACIREIAHKRGDHQRETQAVRQLRRLGVTIRPSRRREVRDGL